MKPITFIEMNRRSAIDGFFDRVKFTNRYAKNLPRGKIVNQEVMMYNYADNVLFGTNNCAMAMFHLPEISPFSEIKQNCIARIEGKVIVLYEDKDIVDYKKALPPNVKRITLKMHIVGEGDMTIDTFDMTYYNINFFGMTSIIKALPVGIDARYLQRLEGYLWSAYHNFESPKSPVVFEEHAHTKERDGYLEIVVMPIRDQVFYDFEGVNI